jgi:acyl-CoA hydrolase
MMRSGRDTKLSAIDWKALVRPGDLVVWSQASAEPVALTASLLGARAAVGPFRAFVGISNSPQVDSRFTDYVLYTSYCGTGKTRALNKNLDILPVPYGKLADALGRESPILLISLAYGTDADHFSFGAAGDYTADLVNHARLVIAEVSECTPRTGRGKDLQRSQIDFIVHSDSTPPETGARQFDATEAAVASQVAGLIPDGATLQLGLGTVPAAVLRALSGHRDLGIHSGLLIDEVAELAEAEVITNARKSVDRGISVAGLLAGGPRLMRWANGNAKLALRPTSFTHDASVLASIDRLAAVNSAIEVDLTGQVNAEVAAGRYVGAVGGSGSFLRGARESRGGLPIIALRSTYGAGSRIVARLSGPVSICRADVGFVVTEHGVADLRGLTLQARRQRMLNIAHPEHRGALDADSGHLTY